MSIFSSEIIVHSANRTLFFGLVVVLGLQAALLPRGSASDISFRDAPSSQRLDPHGSETTRGVQVADNHSSKGTLPPTLNVSGFRDGASHWRKLRDPNRVIQPLPDQPAYSPDQIEQIVNNILLFQRMNGGWPKDYDLLAILTPEQRSAIESTRNREDTSFDNHNIHSQVDYLARAFALNQEQKWQTACIRGLDFILGAQMESGGFPQRFPHASGYSAHITFNDGVMIGILNVLQDVAESHPHWEWLDQPRREKARLAVSRGVECILKCQIQDRGVPTGWCQQHEASTYLPASARTFELASCCPQETTEIVRFLMRINSQEERVTVAIKAGERWLQKVKLTGIRLERVPAPIMEFERYRSEYDIVVREEDQTPPIWARHYEIGTDRPVFAGRDAVKRYELKEIERERRTGTVWYGTWPQKLLEEDYPRWQKSHSMNASKPKETPPGGKPN